MEHIGIAALVIRSHLIIDYVHNLLVISVCLASSSQEALTVNICFTRAATIPEGTTRVVLICGLEDMTIVIVIPSDQYYYQCWSKCQ
jgi:ABC-type Fe3+-hydroxamate transport system substrate-binding protein